MSTRSDELLGRLYSSDPTTRLDSASCGTLLESEFIPGCEEWLVNAFGAVNAWLLAVGPSPGTGPGGKVKHVVPPVLGSVLSEFEQFAEPDNDIKGFWRELFRLVRVGFEHAGVGVGDRDAALKLMMLVNLDTDPQGNGAKVTREKLRAGMPRLSRVLEVTKPRVVLALKTDVYEEIYEWWGRERGQVSGQQEHAPVCTKKQRFYGKSCWLTRNTASPILLVKILQHPSKATLYRGYEALFSAYLGERIVEALKCSNATCTKTT